MLAALPIELVEPTPFQRNLSDTHARKLKLVIGKIGLFLYPVIAVPATNGDQIARCWTPNGSHRLSAMKTLGAKCIVAIMVTEAAAAYQIFATNTEKAHNLREKSLEVTRMYKDWRRSRVRRKRPMPWSTRSRPSDARPVLWRTTQIQRPGLPSGVEAAR